MAHLLITNLVIATPRAHKIPTFTIVIIAALLVAVINMVIPLFITIL